MHFPRAPGVRILPVLSRRTGTRLTKTLPQFNFGPSSAVIRTTPQKLG